MSKKKVSNCLLGSMISATLLLNTLLVNLPLNSQPIPGETIQETTQRKLSPAEIKQKIKQIKKVSDRIKRAKIAAPALLITGSVAALATLATTAVASYFLIRFLRLKKFPANWLKNYKQKMLENTKQFLNTQYLSVYNPQKVRNLLNKIEEDPITKKIIESPKKTKKYGSVISKLRDNLSHIKNILSETPEKLGTKEFYIFLQKKFKAKVPNLANYEPIKNLQTHIANLEKLADWGANKQPQLRKISKNLMDLLKPYNQYKAGKGMRFQLTNAQELMWIAVTERDLPVTKREIVRVLKMINYNIMEKALGGWEKVDPLFKEKAKEEIVKEVGDFLNNQENTLTKTIKKTIAPKLKKLGILAGISGIGAILLGLAGTGMATVGAIFGLSALSVKTALNNAKELEEQIADLTFQQKQILANFQKQLKSLIINGMVKNIRLKGKLTNLVNAAMLTHAALIKPLKNETKEKKEKRTRKIFSDYIKARKQEKLMQKVADEYADLNVSGFKVFNNKRKLKKQKKRVAKMQAAHPGIKTALETAVQKYSQAEDKMLEGIKENLMEAIDTKEFQREMQGLQQKGQPIVPL